MHGRLGMGLMLQNIAYLKEGVGLICFKAGTLNITVRRS